MSTGRLLVNEFCFVAAVVVMLAVAGFAGYLPARRAAKVDLMVALRSWSCICSIRIVESGHACKVS
jgi:hypothetical protein